MGGDFKATHTYRWPACMLREVQGVALGSRNATQLSDNCV